MNNHSLQSAIDQQGSAVEVLRNAKSRPFTFPVTPEFTNPAAAYRVGRAKQLVAINPDGYLIGDGILFHLAERATGTEVTVLWGEKPNTGKAQVERHRQVEMRATVAPVRFTEYARAGYRTS